MTKKQIFENKIRKMVREEMLKEGIVRQDVLQRYVDECISKIQKSSNVSSAKDTILIAESICDYLNKKHIRYKSSVDKYEK